VAFGKGNTRDLTFIPKHFKNTARRRKKIINLDKGYTSKELRRNSKRSGTRINMQTRTGDYTAKRGPKFSFDEEKYKVRFQVERFNSWLKSFNRVRLRREFNSAMYKAFVYLAIIIILVRN